MALFDSENSLIILIGECAFLRLLFTGHFPTGASPRTPCVRDSSLWEYRTVLAIFFSVHTHLINFSEVKRVTSMKELSYFEKVDSVKSTLPTQSISAEDMNGTLSNELSD